ncbi:MAG: hypothetical protein JW734_00590 [Candidatus Omnitrophica bacterium]|nr:hypothetical protein [Candidatus Omnitrophota bacterium]
MEEEHVEKRVWNCFNFGSEICDAWVREKYKWVSPGRKKELLSERDTAEADAICSGCANFIPVE